MTTRLVQPRPRGRRWALADLHQGTRYLLEFDPVARRWEAYAEGSSEPLVTRSSVSPQGSPASAPEGDPAAPDPSGGAPAPSIGAAVDEGRHRRAG